MSRPSSAGEAPSCGVSETAKTKVLFLELGEVLKLLFLTYLLPALISQLELLFVRALILIDFAFFGLLLFFFGGARFHSVAEFTAIW